MRILHLDAGHRMRGGQWQALRLIQGLGSHGVEVSLLCPSGSPLFQKAAGFGVEVHPLHVVNVARFSRRADLTHAHDARSHTLAAVLSASPLIVSRRVAFPIRSRWKYGHAAHYIAISEFVRQTLLTAGVPPEKVSVVYDGVPLLPPVTSEEKLIAPATGTDRMKGSDLVLEATRLAGFAVHFSTDLESDLAAAALFVYITHSEGLGSGILMALSAGVPVIASRVGGIPEIITHEVSGLLTENTPVAIAANIRRVMEDRSLARLLSARGRQLIEEKFAVNEMVRNTIRVYERVLSC